MKQNVLLEKFSVHFMSAFFVVDESIISYKSEKTRVRSGRCVFADTGLVMFLCGSVNSSVKSILGSSAPLNWSIRCRLTHNCYPLHCPIL